MYRKERIIGYEEYFVDTDGVIYGKNGRPLKPSVNGNGYCIINLYTNHCRVGFAVHTLVAKQFIKQEYGKTEVNHKDGNKKNNSVTNLEWVTPGENARHAVDVLGKRIGTSNKNAKQTYAMDNTGAVIHAFSTLLAAARFISGDSCTVESALVGISRAISGSRKTYKGFVWSH